MNENTYRMMIELMKTGKQDEVFEVMVAGLESAGIKNVTARNLAYRYMKQIESEIN